MAGTVKLPLVAIFFSATLAFGTSQGCKESVVVVNALDDHGVPIPSLSSAHFKASHRGKPLGVGSLEHRNVPNARIIVLLDTSGSMRGSSNTKWKIAHAAALEFVSSAPAPAQVSLITFAAAVEQKFGTVGDRSPILAWLNSPKLNGGEEAKGRTALYDAIREAFESFGQTRPGDVIYVITDGQDNSSKEKISQLRHSFEGSGVRLFAFLLDDPNPPGRPGGRDLYDLARGSGGFVMNDSPRWLGPGWSSYDVRYEYSKETVAAIHGATQILQAQIASFYVLRVQVPDNWRKAEDWNLAIVDAQGRNRKGVTPIYPSKLAPTECPTQSAER